MKNVLSYRAMGSLCRQRAVFDPESSWKHLGEAERWEHLAHAEIASHFKECNTDCSSDAYLQTRMTRDGRRLPPHKYTLVRDAKYLWPILNTKTRAIWSAFDV